MVWLRFAEPPEVIAKLSKSDGSVLDELLELVSAGFVSECFGTYILRIEFRNLLTNRALNTWKTEKLESALQFLVDVFREEADDPEQINPRAIAPTSKEACIAWSTGSRMDAAYPRFNPFIYSLENDLPLVKFGLDDKWAPDQTSKAMGLIVSYNTLRWARVIVILWGWFQATVLVAAIGSRFKS